MRIGHAICVSLGLGVAGCGDNIVPASPDATIRPDVAAPFAEAPHQAPPQMVSDGGNVLAAPRIQPIFFTGDDAMQAQIEPYFAALAASTYWATTTSEYGVGPLTIATSIVSSDPPPTSDSALQTWLASQLDGTHVEFGTPDLNTVYAVYLPTNVQLSTPFGDSCSSFGGYHDEAMSTQGGSIVYALLPRCGPELDTLTDVTSHEFIEASTDPFVETNLAYGDIDVPHEIYAVAPGAEVGDMCEYVHAADQRMVGGYVVQRTWSNASALAGHDPCVPVMSTPYVGAAPAFPDQVTIDFGGQGGQFMTQGVQVPVGTSKTIEVDLFSDAPTDDWTVVPYDAASQIEGSASELTLTLDKATGNNGDKLMLTITHKTAGEFGGSEFLLSSKVNNGSVSQWWGFVAN